MKSNRNITSNHWTQQQFSTIAGKELNSTGHLEPHFTRQPLIQSKGSGFKLYETAQKKPLQACTDPDAFLKELIK